MPRSAHAFVTKTLDELTIDDEPAFRHVALYASLKEILRRDAVPFRVLPRPSAGRADRALLLNLTFWGLEPGADILPSPRIDADVVTHAAWHHLAAKMIGARSAPALFLGESIASAFDVYLVGRLLASRHARRSSFLATQVPQMAESAQTAGLEARDLEALLESIAADPERAFEDLRSLLFDATTLLYACRDAVQAHRVLVDLGDHRFAPLLHRYEISNWVLYARAYASVRSDGRAERVDVALREADSAVDWLTGAWVTPALPLIKEGIQRQRKIAAQKNRPSHMKARKKASAGGT
ncbi:MAG: hypothetical protein KF819_35740 [Labilithrix sp.]|nr:hypothetical protein [Labilithrix sp.]